MKPVTPDWSSYDLKEKDKVVAIDKVSITSKNGGGRSKNYIQAGEIGRITGMFRMSPFPSGESFIITWNNGEISTVGRFFIKKKIRPNV